jgi:hypothetical protein
MGRISRTISLAKASWHVIRADKELLWLPIMSGIASLVVAASFLVPLLLSSEGGEPEGVVSYVLLFVMYVALAYVTIFFNAALVHAANERLSGGDPTLGSALAGARHKAGAILPWAVVSATVSVILRAIEERAGAVGRIVAGLAGLAWSLVTFLVLPILVLEDVGVGDAVRGSAQLFKRTWGENVAAQIGFGLLGFLLILPAFAIVAVGVGTGSEGLLAGSIVVAVLWGILVAVVMSALGVVFQVALYRYATHGEAGGEFSSADLNGAFAPKRR